MTSCGFGTYYFIVLFDNWPCSKSTPEEMCMSLCRWRDTMVHAISSHRVVGATSGFLSLSSLPLSTPSIPTSAKNCRHAIVVMNRNVVVRPEEDNCDKYICHSQYARVTRMLAPLEFRQDLSNALEIPFSNSSIVIPSFQMYQRTRLREFSFNSEILWIIVHLPKSITFVCMVGYSLFNLLA
jgi:hypothetical protein